MTIRVIETQAGRPRQSAWYIFDDRRHMYLDAEGHWQVKPAYFASAVEVIEALRARQQGREIAIQ